MGRENRREIVPRALSPPPLNKVASRFLIIFAVVLFIMLFKIKIILTSESVSQILKCSLM